MGWPLIIALAGTAAEAAGESAEEEALKEATLENELKKQQALERKKEIERKKARKAALARALDSGPQPLTGEDYVGYTPEEPDLEKSQIIKGVGRLGQQLGPYIAGGQSSSSMIDEEAPNYYTDKRAQLGRLT